MQFAYQFPELTERLVLVASGGLGQGVTIDLRAAILPGSPLVFRALAARTPPWLASVVHRAVRGRAGAGTGRTPRGWPTRSPPSPTAGTRRLRPDGA
jgi:hypothetical protein